MSGPVSCSVPGPTPSQKRLQQLSETLTSWIDLSAAVTGNGPLSHPSIQEELALGASVLRSGRRHLCKSTQPHNPTARRADRTWLHTAGAHLEGLAPLARPHSGRELPLVHCRVRPVVRLAASHLCAGTSVKLLHAVCCQITLRFNRLHLHRQSSSSPSRLQVARQLGVVPS